MRDFTRAGDGRTLPARKFCLSASILNYFSGYLKVGETLFCAIPSEVFLCDVQKEVRHLLITINMRY